MTDNDNDLTLDPSRTALVLVDLQNDNVHPDGAFASFGAPEHAVEQGLLGHVGELLAWAREHGVPVVHNHIVSFPGHPFGGANAPIFNLIGPDSLQVGSWGASPLEGLEPREDEPLLLRNRMSCFNGTNLDLMLRNLGTTDVVVAGVWTNMAVEHTVRDAADHGYRVLLPADATSSLGADWQHAAVSFALTNIATITTTNAVVSQRS